MQQEESALATAQADVAGKLARFNASVAALTKAILETAGAFEEIKNIKKPRDLARFTERLERAANALETTVLELGSAAEPLYEVVGSVPGLLAEVQRLQSKREA